MRYCAIISFGETTHDFGCFARLLKVNSFGWGIKTVDS